ncbi:MAG: hypothetical protein ACF8R7_13725 [Phycisphaerales bacterium JB039]
MRWRIIRRCLLFATLGLVTAVAAAWITSARWQLRRGPNTPDSVGLAARGNIVMRVTVYRSFGLQRESWMLADTAAGAGPWTAEDAERIGAIGGAAFDIERSSRMVSRSSRGQLRRVDALAARGPRPPVADIAPRITMVEQLDTGWPLRALRSTVRSDLDGISTRPPTTLRGGVRIPWRWIDPGARPRLPLAIILPLAPRPGLAINALLFALLWMTVLLPGAIRRRIRRAKGRCPRCGFSLAGQPQPGCPECGHGREEVAKWPSGEVAK